MDMDQSQTMLEVLQKWQKWDLKSEKELMDSMLQEILLPPLEKDLLLDLPLLSHWLFMVVSYTTLAYK